jgi:hypothetical protein
MRCHPIALLAALAGLSGLVGSLRAEQMTAEEAQRVAENHVRLLVAEGDWKTAPDPLVGPVQEITRSGQVLGYFCPVQPRGYVVLPLHKELGPIRAYADDCNLDPRLEAGMSALIKDGLQRDLRRAAAKLGHAVQPGDRLDALVKPNYRPAYDVLESKDFQPAQYVRVKRSRGGAGMDYQEGEVLLTSRWHQFPPFNNDCPDTDCSYPDELYFNSNAVVGCVATAGAQILRHWNYAPILQADWPSMRNYYDPNWDFNEFVTEAGTASAAEIEAVAMISHALGVMVDMDYGCDGSSSNTADMEEVFESVGYSDNAHVDSYGDYDDPVAWFNVMKNQLNLNRPTQMGITGHSIVCDGWKIETAGATVYYYHMNYGWRSESSNAWYVLMHLPDDDDETDDILVTSIVPAIASGAELNSTNYGADGYRYWDRDPTAVDTTFQVGNWIQILRSGCYLRCVGTGSQAIRFYGSSGHDTRLFLDGDPGGKTRVLVKGGGLKIGSGAGMVIR